MSKALLSKHFFISVVVMAFALLSSDVRTLAFYCIVDICIALLLMLEILIYANERNVNLLSPKLWALLGYLTYGQVPLVVNILFLDQRYDYNQHVPEMLILVMSGYRALLLPMCVWHGSEAIPRRVYHIWPGYVTSNVLLLIGLLARLFIRNNVFDTGIGEWSWYFAFIYAASPLGLGCLIGRWSEARSRAWGHRVLFGTGVSISLLTGLLDVSRKDTGSIILTLILVLAADYSSGRIFLRLNPKLTVRLGCGLVILGILLMGTRAYSWSRVNNNYVLDEIAISFEKRRANDVTDMLALVLDTVPSQYPFLFGETIGSLLPIPRIFWPSRPPGHSHYVGLQYLGYPALEYHPELTGNNQLSISAHMLGEGYANFGTFGALGFEFVFGALVVHYERLLAEGRLFVLRCLFPVVLFFIFTQQRGDIASMNTQWMLCGGVLYAMVQVNRLFGGRWGRTVVRDVA